MARDLTRRARILGESSSLQEGGVQRLHNLPPADRLQVQDLEQDIRLKKRYAGWLLTAMMVQLFVANTVFVVYAWAGMNWRLSTSVINVWLGATLAEVVGVVLVVTRYLFPRRDTFGPK